MWKVSRFYGVLNSKFKSRTYPVVFWSNIFNQSFSQLCSFFTSISINWLKLFQDATSCSHCNGFYGPNCNQPLCVSCHKFLFPNKSKKRRLFRTEADASYSKFCRFVCISDRIDQPAVSTSKRIQLKDLSKFFSEGYKHTKSENTTVKGNIGACSKGTIPKSDGNSKIKSENKSEAMPEVTSDTHISVLPVEMLSKIFSYLNNDTLFEVSKVSQQWQRIIDNQTQQEGWKNLTTKRWPLLERKTETKSWLKVRNFKENVELSSFLC